MVKFAQHDTSSFFPSSSQLTTESTPLTGKKRERNETTGKRERKRERATQEMTLVENADRTKLDTPFFPFSLWTRLFGIKLSESIDLSSYLAIGGVPTTSHD